MKKLCGFLLVLTLCLGLHTAFAAYSSVGPYPVPRIVQRDTSAGGLGADCFVCSMASVEAYFLGNSTFQYSSYARAYNGVGDYVWSSDPLWRKIYAMSGYDMDVGDVNLSGLPYPMEKGSYSIAAGLPVIYNQLHRGSPVVVHCSVPNKVPHASVIIGYKGNGATTLKASDFIVMEIKRWDSNGYTGGLNSVALFNSCMTNAVSKTTAADALAVWNSKNSQCYYTLQAWLLKTFGTESCTLNLRWVTTPPGANLKVFTENAIEVMDVKVVENGGNRRVAYQYPYGASAELTDVLAVGNTVRVVSSVINSYNNLWYRTGSGRYIWSGIVEFDKSVPNLQYTGMTLSGAYDAGTLPKLSGVFTADSCLTTVTARVHRDSAQGEVVQEAAYAADDLRTLKIDLAATSLASDIDLNTLASGAYTLVLNIAYGTHGESADYQYDFSVTSKGPAQITLTAPETVLVGDTFPLAVEILPAEYADAALTYASSDPTYATVDAKGIVTVHKLGKVILTATAENGVIGSVTIDVQPNVESVSLVIGGFTWEQIGAAVVCEIGKEYPYELVVNTTNGVQAEYIVDISSDTSCVAADTARSVFTAQYAGEDVLQVFLGMDREGTTMWLADTISCTIFVQDAEHLLRLPADLTEVEVEAFAGTSGYEVALGSHVTHVAADAFAEANVVYVENPAGLTIDAGAFRSGAAIVDMSGMQHADFRSACEAAGYRYFYAAAQ